MFFGFLFFFVSLFATMRARPPKQHSFAEDPCGQCVDQRCDRTQCVCPLGEVRTSGSGWSIDCESGLYKIHYMSYKISALGF